MLIGGGVTKLALACRDPRPIPALLHPGPAFLRHLKRPFAPPSPAHANNHIVTFLLIELSMAISGKIRRPTLAWSRCGKGRGSCEGACTLLVRCHGLFLPSLPSPLAVASLIFSCPLILLDALPCLSDCRSRGLQVHHCVEPLRRPRSSANTSC